jgi:hypothetical protein
MPRASRHYIPGYVWHITHRCPKKEFLLRLSSGQTILISHSIDLAHRVDALREGDTVEFFGEYEWNSKGGVVHWTHHDPEGRHKVGWLKHNGSIYQ